MPNGLRFRERGGYSPSGWSYTSNTGVTYSGAIGKNGTYESMTDMVSSPFIPGKTIKSNGMQRHINTQSYTPISGSQTHNLTTGTTGYSGSAPWWGTWDTKIVAVATEKFPRYDHLISLAATQALSNAQRGDGDFLVSLLELRSTLQGLAKPLAGALGFLDHATRWNRNKIRRAQRSTKFLADQHLSIVFGLMPFIEDIQTLLKALGDAPLRQRYTYRGYASETVDNDWTEGPSGRIVYDSGGTRERVYCDIKANRTVHARAWLLCEREITLNDRLGLTLQSIPRALVLASPYSFIVDWFANLSSYVSAITPNPRITILSQGWSVQDIVSGVAIGKYTQERNTATGPNGWTGSWNGGKHVYLNQAKYRHPADLSELVGFHLKSNVHKDILDLFKITALISLATQKLNRIDFASLRS